MPVTRKTPSCTTARHGWMIKIFGFWPFFSFSNGLISPAPRAECPTCVSRGRGDIRHTQWQEALIPSEGTNNLGVWRWISAPAEEGQHLPLQSAPLLRKPTSGARPRDLHLRSTPGLHLRSTRGLHLAQHAQGSSSHLPKAPQPVCRCVWGVSGASAPHAL